MSQHLNNHKKTIRLLLKGGPDVLDSLTGGPGNNTAEPNLLTEWRATKEADGTAIHITFEPGFPAAILLQQLNGVVLPAELGEQGLNNEQITSQFQSKLFEQPFDVVVLSILPEITAEVWQNRDSGYFITPPPDWRKAWSSEQCQWFQTHFTALGQSGVEQFQENLSKLVRTLQTDSKTQIVVYGVSSYDPVDTTHNYHSINEPLSLRALRFIHALIQISEQIGLDIVDTDRLIAEAGAKTQVDQLFHYTKEANRAIGQELLQIIEDQGYFDEHPLLKLEFPQMDMQFQSGSIVRWHQREGKRVQEGDDLFDLRVEEIKRLRRMNADRPSEIETVEETTNKKWSLLVRVTATDTGFLRKKFVQEGETSSIGDLLAVFSIRKNERLKIDDDEIADAPTFRVMVNLLETADNDI